MQDTDQARALERFRAYADAFEVAYETDDWSVLEPYFTPDTTSELNGTVVAGRDAVLASFRNGVAMFDRRFDSRAVRMVVGPEIRDGRVHIEVLARYERAGLPALELRGKEWFTFAGDRIVRHVDNVVNATEVMRYLGAHTDALRPFVPRAPEATRTGEPER